MLVGVRFVRSGLTLTSVLYYVSVMEPTCEHHHIGCTGNKSVTRYLVKMLFDVVFQSSYSYSLYY